MIQLIILIALELTNEILACYDFCRDFTDDTNFFADNSYLPNPNYIYNYV